MESPLISVLMGIYNCETTLEEAVECIINQTYTNWELIMCDDGSKDNTFNIAMDFVNKYPSKIVLLKNEQNKGLNYTLNKCLKYAKGTYIARMDADDTCSKERFEIELQAFEHEPDIDIVSTDMTFFDETGEWGLIQHPDYPEKKDFVHESPFCHAPCMVKTEAMRKVGGYSVSDYLLRVEDYHLWFKMYNAGYKGKNIHIPLYQMRDDRNAYARRNFKNRRNEFYVKCLIVKEYKLPKINYIYALRPIIVWLMPKPIYDYFHKRRIAK